MGQKVGFQLHFDNMKQDGLGPEDESGPRFLCIRIKRTDVRFWG